MLLATMNLDPTRNNFKTLGRALRRLRAPAPDTNLRADFLSSLRGVGLEIGPLHNPFPVPPGSRVVYADKFDVETLRRHNADVPPERIVVPDIVCDTHTLTGVAAASFDFLIACHVLEHAHDPVAGLMAWHRVLKLHGLALCVLPDARYTFDAGRPLTTLDHLVWDYENEGTELKALSDLQHVAECNLNMHDHLTPSSAFELAREICATTYDTHFHVWTYETFEQQLQQLIANHGLPFRIVRSACDGRLEMLFLLESLPARRLRLSRRGAAQGAAATG
jgi:SAM-dependent methyltransferase